MKFTDVLSRLTGLSFPVFGVSWNPPESQRSIARKIIVFLEARRVLYSPYEYETVHPVISSVVEIKNFLSSELPKINKNSELEGYVRQISSAYGIDVEDDLSKIIPTGN